MRISNQCVPELLLPLDDPFDAQSAGRTVTTAKRHGAWGRTPAFGEEVYKHLIGRDTFQFIS
jgi:hypothetical protein